MVPDVILETKIRSIAFHNRENIPWFAECSCDTYSRLILASLQISNRSDDLCIEPVVYVGGCCASMTDESLHSGHRYEALESAQNLRVRGIVWDLVVLRSKILIVEML